MGKNLKGMGKPLGQALGHSTGDPPSFAYPYMWSYGAMEVEDDGKTIAFNKPEFVDGMNTFVQAWKDAYDETGLSWDDGVNNRALPLGSDSPARSTAAASTSPPRKRPRAPIDHRLRGSGRSGRHHPWWLPGGAGRSLQRARQHVLRVDEVLRNQEAGKALLDVLDWQGAVHRLAGSAEGIHHPAAFRVTPRIRSTRAIPKLAPYLDVVNYGRNKGFAGPANQKAAQAGSQYIVVDTFAKAIQNGDAKGAIEEGARLLERIYGR